MANEATSNSEELSSEKPFDFNEPRQKLIHDSLLMLVSPGAAAFYKDACRLKMTRPAFGSATHLVAHLLREVESALHDILKSITEQKLEFEICPTCRQKINKMSHSDKIRIVGDKLKLSEEVIKAWLSISGQNGLQKLAHRSGLGPVRLADDGFEELWSKMETIFYVVLDNLETHYSEILKKLDELSQKIEPTKEDAKFFASNIPNNYNTYAYFFKNLSNPKWLLFLRGEGIFSNPPEPEYDPEKRTIRHLPWPAATYLEKIAPTESKLVKDILNEVKDVDNSSVKADLLKITANLSREHRIQLLKKVKSWIRTQHNFFQFKLTDPTSKLIDKFIEEGEENAAFDLAFILLEILPDTKKVEQTGGEKPIYKPKRKPQMRLEHWGYNEFLKNGLKKLIELNPKRSFDLMCSLLQDYLKIENEDREEKDHEYEDLSYISRPAIENHEQNHDYGDIKNGLITAARDVGLQIIEKEPTAVKNLLAELEARKWTLFSRLGFYLLAKVPDAAPDLVAKQLTNQSFFDNSNVKHEYAQLMNNGFRILDEKDQKIILEWIDKAEIGHMKGCEKEFDRATLLKVKEGWQRDQLSHIKDDLPTERRSFYDNLVKKYGEPKHPDFPAYFSGGWVGPKSDVKAQDLADMEPDKLIELLKTWKPKTEPHDFGPTKEGLGRELGSAIKLKPEYFNNLADNFKDLDPNYIRSYLQSFGEIAQHDGTLDWEKLLNLSYWVVKQPREIPGRKGEMMDQDPDWNWTRKAISSLISAGTNHNLISCEFREKVWSIIEPLTHDPEPTPADEAQHEKNSDDAYGLAINSARGEAMGATMEYALWIYRCIEKSPNGKEKIKLGFTLMPEVKTILDWHINPGNDPSVAVRAIYGRFFPWLLLMDRQWVLDNLNQILPLGQLDNRLYAAAWNTIMLYVPAYNESFEILKDRYFEAVKNLGKVDREHRRYTDRDERLAEHLMLFYGRDKLQLSDNLLQEFWKMADDEIRGHALDFVGRHLKSDGDFDAEILERTKALWESRITVAKSAEDKTNHEKEMSAFGWWFVSGRFDDKWSSDQYLEALEIGKKTQNDYLVAERLGGLVKTLPIESVRILSKIVLVDEPSWIILGNKEEINSVLSAALQAPEETARDEARALISRLAIRGYTEFNNLLNTANSSTPIDQV